jgi:four helix bundle protein
MQMEKIESHRDLDAWKVAMDLVLESYALAARLPFIERFGLAFQIRKSAVSVPSNIAEGQGYGPGARNLHHVQIASGSLAELDTQLEIASRQGYIPFDDLERARGLIDRTGRLLTGVRQWIRRKQTTEVVVVSIAVVMLLRWFWS